jgi:hypothetical protein
MSTEKYRTYQEITQQGADTADRSERCLRRSLFSRFSEDCVTFNPCSTSPKVLGPEFPQTFPVAKRFGCSVNAQRIEVNAFKICNFDLAPLVEWYEGQWHDLEELVRTLIGRRGRVRELIDAFRQSPRRPFPNWEGLFTPGKIDEDRRAG